MLDRFSVVIVLLQIVGQIRINFQTLTFIVKLVGKIVDYQYAQEGLPSDDISNIEFQSFSLMNKTKELRKKNAVNLLKNKSLKEKSFIILAFVALICFISIYIVRLVFKDIFFHFAINKYVVNFFLDENNVYSYMNEDLSMVLQYLDFINGILIIGLFYFFSRQKFDKKKKLKIRLFKPKVNYEKVKVLGEIQRISGDSESTSDSRPSSQSLQQQKQLNSRISLYKDLNVYYKDTEIQEHDNDTDSLFEAEIAVEQNDSVSVEESFINSLYLENQQIKFSFNNKRYFAQAGIQ
ncbi:UNKNOWN [Stylonychia lemnae]|uniref:Transmembrane protein n=1 Tax=Stylonychia lemnae TaxID=5949 RepID=A0A078APV5_STYLE|nr:UNKNOWN [Stylonychia lemnae]|eukprot:CDW84006.1 UNKNOWN [Stylonychia lemnae]